MTTHEAMALHPNTQIRHAHLRDPDDNYLTGVAHPMEQRYIRIVWDDLAESDSVINKADRLILDSIVLLDPIKEPGA